jgi:hypothetical protein
VERQPDDEMKAQPKKKHPDMNLAVRHSRITLSVGKMTFDVLLTLSCYTRSTIVKTLERCAEETPKYT